MVAQSRRRASVLPVSVDRRWDWLLGQVPAVNFMQRLNNSTSSSRYALDCIYIVLLRLFHRGPSVVSDSPSCA